MLITVVVGACAPEPQALDEIGTPTPGIAITPSLLPGAQTATPLPASDSTDQPAPVAEAGALGCVPSAATAAVQHEITATLDWIGHSLVAEQRVLFRNDTGQSLEKIMFNVESNREPGYFDLQRVTVAGRRTQNFLFQNVELTVYLDHSLVPCETAEIVLTYTQTLPQIANGYRFGRLGYWGYSDRQVNLGLWFPVVAVYDAVGGWQCPAFHDVGEHYVLGSADFTVDFSVKNAPEDVHVAGPGVVTQIDGNSWRFELKGGRELTLSVSDRFKMLTTETESGVDVELYYLFDSSSETLDAPRHALGVAADAVTLYENLYGDYPHERLVVIEGDFPDGMEFSGLVFVSEAWFRTWQGTPNDWLTIITAHEISHQWWYGLVGNDQGQQPYLDEALAVYSELLFYEEYYPEYVDWWWGFRVNSHEPRGYVDASVYDFNGVRAYIDIVYLRGALLVQALRDALGDQAFFDWLKTYVESMEGQVAYPVDFWGTLSEVDYEKTEFARVDFLREPNVLPDSDMIP